MSLFDRIAAMFRRAPAPVPPEPVPLVEVLRAAGMTVPERWARHLAEPCARYAITPGRRLAAFAATIAHESAGGTVLVENLNYTPAGLVKTWPSRFTQATAAKIGRTDGHPANQPAIAEHVYGGRMGNTAPGDGWRYRVRGLIQLTGGDAYRLAGRALGLPLEDQPDLAAQEAHAALIAAWAWSEWKGCNPLADAGDIEGWRRRINGGLIGLEDVRRRYAAAI